MAQLKKAASAGKQAPPKPQPQEETKNGPVDHINLFPVSASIWMRYTSEGAPFYSVSFQRTYKDAQGQWQYTGSFNPGDLLLLAEVARTAYHMVDEMRRKDREESTE